MVLMRVAGARAGAGADTGATVAAAAASAAAAGLTSHEVAVQLVDRVVAKGC